MVDYTSLRIHVPAQTMAVEDAGKTRRVHMYTITKPPHRHMLMDVMRACGKASLKQN